MHTNNHKKCIHIISAHFLAAASNKCMHLLTSPYGILNHYPPLKRCCHGKLYLKVTILQHEQVNYILPTHFLSSKSQLFNRDSPMQSSLPTRQPSLFPHKPTHSLFASESSTYKRYLRSICQLCHLFLGLLLLT